MFKDRLRRQDLCASLQFALCLPAAMIYRKIHPDIWLVSERPDEARDNGYWFYKYACKDAMNPDVYYVVSRNGVDAQKVRALGKTVDFGSIHHYFLYLAASKHISSQIDGGMPNMRVCSFLERHGLLNNKKCFLQHGITKDVISFGFYKDTRVNLFVCAAKVETDFVAETFGYPEGAVQELGFARYDNLVDTSNGKRKILVMPTWRAWLAKGKSDNIETARKRFAESDYCKRWSKFIHSASLKELLERYDCTVFFYPHSDMQPFVDMFHSDHPRIQIADAQHYDVQNLMKSSSVLITDYSSVAFDFAYMKKPLIYYHFDYDAYRKGQHPEGYFSYEKHGFGPVVHDEAELMKELTEIVRCGSCPEIYADRIKAFFDLQDQNNCKRIYEAVQKM